MKKAVIILMLLTLLSKCIGFFRDVTLAYFYGASGLSDAYLVAITIPSVIFGVIATGISTGYMPMFSRVEENEGTRKAVNYTNNLINTLVVICTGIIILGLVFAGPIVRVFASGFEGSVFDTAVLFTRITLVGIYFTILIRILSAYLNYRKYFAVPNLLGIPMSIIVILSIILSDRTNTAEILAYGYVAALFVQFIILLIFSYRKQFRYRPVLNIKDEHMKTMLILAVPVILGSAVNQINKLVDRTLASQVAEGGISALNYAHTLNNSLLGIFVASISTVMYPLISKMAAKDDMKGLKRSLSQAMTGVTVLILPATAASLFFADPIVRLLFGRGAFDDQAAAMTSAAFFFYSIGMIGMGLRTVLSRAFYSLQDTKTPMINAAIAMGLNIILNFILVQFMGLGGLAFATSIAAITATLLLGYNLRKKIGRLHLRRLFFSVIKISIASLAMGLAARLLYMLMMNVANFSVSLLFSLFAAGLIYALLISFMRIDDVDHLTAAVKRRLSRRKT